MNTADMTRVALLTKHGATDPTTQDIKGRVYEDKGDLIVNAAEGCRWFPLDTARECMWCPLNKRWEWAGR